MAAWNRLSIVVCLTDGRDGMPGGIRQGLQATLQDGELFHGESLQAVELCGLAVAPVRLAQAFHALSQRLLLIDTAPMIAVI